MRFNSSMAESRRANVRDNHIWKSTTQSTLAAAAQAMTHSHRRVLIPGTSRRSRLKMPTHVTSKV